MSRRNFADILNSAGVDIAKEYQRLIVLFYRSPNAYRTTLEEYVNQTFQRCPFRGTCISLADFNDTHGFVFPTAISSSDIDTLVLFCEYSCNLLSFVSQLGHAKEEIKNYIRQVKGVISKIGYERFDKDGLILFVPKSQAVTVAAQIVDASISYKVIEYNHHSLHGNVEAKKNILLLFANQLEPRREELSTANRTLSADLFMLFNNLNIRHNNVDSSSPNYKEIVAKMSDAEIEQWYDDTYMLCLEAFIALDNVSRKDSVKQLREKL